MRLEEYVKYDGLGLAELVRTGGATPGELAATALEAIEAVNPELNAVIEIYRDRIDDLEEDELRDGPMRGVPFLMKDKFTMPYNVTGLPAISLPLAETKERLPMGIQLGSHHAEEGRLLCLASALEQALPWRDRIPSIHASRA